MIVPFKDTPKIIFSDKRHTLRYKDVEELVVDGISYYVVSTTYENAVQMIKDRSALAKVDKISVEFAKANNKFVVENLDQDDPNSFVLMMSEFKDWKEIIEDTNDGF